ncbi:DUF4865 family protein [Actinacidiphila soli]|uniref:DUF4865 family protein n=1 Tax=Actinacidiphila soli TaxID=2487275 RepID=UPI000FCB02D2|nr:DUF4865 family protein [Actinacidiphila soli]
MYAMQYELTLPADYDMKIIRERVARTGRMMDDYEGLGFKAFVIRERGVGALSQPPAGGGTPGEARGRTPTRPEAGRGSDVNQYAPFYLWDDTGGMNRFLWGGGGFRNIVDFVGRPPVNHWTGVAFAHGPARDAQPRGASRVVERIPAGVDPQAAVASAVAAWEDRAGSAGVHLSVLAVDPWRWEVVRFTLWEGAAPEGADSERYEVLHLSAPHLDEVPVGRQWA